ncbi:MAG: substrate-binding domain-containing protein, partial [Gammaproteobacteria bacterium]|nr:substrate-binding domain-containing protein [Gammaproteobacteria bacterium]
PVAWDALVAIVHSSNPVDDVTFRQLRDIYLGKITNWQALGGPNKPLEFYIRRGKISGVGRAARRLLFDDLSLEFKARKYFDSSAPLEKAVEDSPWSLAVTGASSARKRDVKILTLEGKTAGYDSIRSGDYSLFLPLFLVVNAQNQKQPLIEQFVQFAYSPEGMAIMRRNGVVPYNDALHLVMKEREQAERARSR